MVVAQEAEGSSPTTPALKRHQQKAQHDFGTGGYAMKIVTLVARLFVFALALPISEALMLQPLRIPVRLRGIVPSRSPARIITIATTGALVSCWLIFQT